MLWTPAETADKIVVASDLHFGVSDAFSQNVANRSLFARFVGQLAKVGDVRELVIAGDFLDEWIVPQAYPPHDDSGAFYRACIANNRQVFEALEAAAAVGIKIVYVPGNHDMTLAEDVTAEALPHVVQARDAVGLGAYITGDRNEIAIEHCHRYDVYSAPDLVSNREIANGATVLLPPGYFYAQLGTEWVAEGKPKNTVEYPVIGQPPAASDVDQQGAYVHYRMMTEVLLAQYTPNIGFTEKIFSAGFAGLDGPYAEYDLCPRLLNDGTISSPMLYRNFQRTWEERQTLNRVRVKRPFIEAATNAANPTYYRDQARIQYFDDPGSNIEVVVFGHTHVPDFRDFGGGRYYVNEGTWIDDNLNADLTRTFAVITTGEHDAVSILHYREDGTASDVTARCTGC